MATFDSHESNRFGQAAAAAGQEYLETREKILTDSAARGFPIVAGESLSALLQVSLKARQKLTEASGKVYEEEYTRILELSTFNLKMLIEVRRVALLQYRNALKKYEESVQHIIRQKEIDHENLAATEETDQAALRLAQAQVRIDLVTYQAQVRSDVLKAKKDLDKARIDFNLMVRLDRVTLEHDSQIAIDGYEIVTIGKTTIAETQNITDAGRDSAETATASATQNVNSLDQLTVDELIGKK